MTTPEAAPGLPTDGMASLITTILRKYGGTMKGRGDHDIFEALLRYRAELKIAALATPPPALDVERFDASGFCFACHCGFARERAATPPTDEEKSMNDDAKAMAQAMADAHDLGRAEALDGAQERIAAILFGAIDDERFAAVMAALDATPPTDATPYRGESRESLIHRIELLTADLEAERAFDVKPAATPPTDDPGDHFAYICEHMIPANECKVVGCTGGKA